MIFSAVSPEATAGIALGAALLGGVLSLVGSLVANRREFTRQHRVNLFLELLPPIIEDLTKSNPPDPDRMEPRIKTVVRVATVSSRGDRQRAAKLTGPLVPYDKAAKEYAGTSNLENSDPRRQAAGQQLADAKTAAIQELAKAAVDYQGWLARRFAGDRRS